MVFASFDELLHMGGHGFYVWLSYGAGIACVVALVVLPLVTRAQLLADIARRARRDTAAGRTGDDALNEPGDE